MVQKDWFNVFIDNGSKGVMKTFDDFHKMMFWEQRQKELMAKMKEELKAEIKAEVLEQIEIQVKLKGLEAIDDLKQEINSLNGIGKRR